MPRDIFDLLAIHEHDPSIVKAAVTAVLDAARRAADRITRIANRYRETIHDEVNPTSSGAHLLELDPLQAISALAI